MSDVARAAGFSLITVSRALRHPEQVTDATRRRIAAVMAELGYVPNLVAGGLAATETRIVSVIVPYVAHGVFADNIQGVAEALEPAGYCVLLGNSGGAPERSESIVRMLLGHRPAGVIIQGADHTEAARQMLRRTNVPIVEIGTLPKAPIDSVVGYSNIEAARTMTAHLIAGGRKRVAFVNYPPHYNDRAAARLDGYRLALAEAGLAFDPALVVETGFGIREGRLALQDLLARGCNPDAVFCGSDLWAAGMIAECRRRGIVVPDDLAVAGFSDHEIATETDPAITTIRVPRYEIGRKAGELILARLRGEHTGPEIIDLGFAFKKRDST
ncbi:LacI family DNA-binding transcriptional regulator [Bosea sp. (in: a-proteobacteria)]|uniref:LacI family DNA-binding transcriptional regulator n=1 Tax=Bosea sp. (in: a-proteobacteria) TaxID=1871050 RepID=UPI003F6FC11E